jgi:hypothetical protein
METIQCSVWHQSLIKHGSHFASQRESYVVCRPWRTFSEGVVEESRRTSGCHRCQSFSRATELRAEEKGARQPKAELRVKQAATRVRSMSFGVQRMRVHPAPHASYSRAYPMALWGAQAVGSHVGDGGNRGMSKLSPDFLLPRTQVTPSTHIPP